MTGPKLVALAVAGSALLLFPSAHSRAQCRLCQTPTTARSEPLGSDQIRLEVDTSLAFGRLVVAGTGGGSAELRPDGSMIAGGAVASAGLRAMVGTVRVQGEPGRSVRVQLPSRVRLYSLSGGTVEVDEVTSDLPSLPRLDGAGQLTFRFGGRVKVIGDADGEFRGELPIDVDYL